MPGEVRVYGYRWVVLAAFMAVNLTIQVLWISYAPVSSQAQDYYGVSAAAIGALAMVFMVAYLPFSFLASHVLAGRGSAVRRRSRCPARRSQWSRPRAGRARTTCSCCWRRPAQRSPSPSS